MAIKNNDAIVRLLRLYLLLKITESINIDLIMNMLIRSIHNDIFKQKLNANADIKKIHKTKQEKRIARQTKKKRKKNKRYRRLLVIKKWKKRLARKRRFNEVMAKKRRKEYEKFIAYQIQKRKKDRERQLKMEAEADVKQIDELQKLRDELLAIQNARRANIEEIDAINAANKTDMEDLYTEYMKVIEHVDPFIKMRIENEFKDLQATVSHTSEKYLRWQETYSPEKAKQLIEADKNQIVSKHNLILDKIKPYAGDDEACLEKANRFISIYQQRNDILQTKIREYISLAAKEHECKDKVLVLEEGSKNKSELVSDESKPIVVSNQHVNNPKDTDKLNNQQNLASSEDTNKLDKLLSKSTQPTKEKSKSIKKPSDTRGYGHDKFTLFSEKRMKSIKTDQNNAQKNTDKKTNENPEPKITSLRRDPK